MTNPAILSQLSGLQEMMADLTLGLLASEVNRRYHPHLSCLAWYLGRCVYRELYWLREVLAGDDDLTARLGPLFTLDEASAPCHLLPPREHLLAWATEIQGEHLRRLATPGALPASPLLEDDRLPWFLLQERARDYEAMLWVLLARRLHLAGNRPTEGPMSLAWETGPDLVTGQTPHLQARSPSTATLAINQGHYRVGSRGDPFAYDNELPPQAVELSSYRIARQPVTNAEFLGFMRDDGYGRRELWEAEGQEWLATSQASAPWLWREASPGYWYVLGLQGARPLGADEPVFSLNRHEARAYATWVSSLGGELAGALVQHEYQWEVAARAGLLQGTGQVWEWCANPFHPYPGFTPFPDALTSEPGFASQAGVLRGASLHTQGCLRRASFRHPAAPAQRFRLSGLRLVFPPL